MRGLIRAAVGNPVATNLLMVVIVVSRVCGAPLSLQRRGPCRSCRSDVIQIIIEFEGATPEDVE